MAVDRLTRTDIADYLERGVTAMLGIPVPLKTADLGIDTVWQ